MSSSREPGTDSLQNTVASNPLGQSVTTPASSRQRRKVEETSTQIGDFKKGKCLGSGGYATVMIAEHVRTHKRYALKQANMSDPNAIQALNAEACALQAMHHEHILTLSQVLQGSETLYLVLEYLDGGDLFTYVTKQGNFSAKPTRARRIFQQIVSAVHYCHSRLLAHCDLKPDNILLSMQTSNENSAAASPVLVMLPSSAEAAMPQAATSAAWNVSIKLADFGSSKRLGRLHTHVEEFESLGSSYNGTPTPLWIGANSLPGHVVCASPANFGSPLYPLTPSASTIGHTSAGNSGATLDQDEHELIAGDVAALGAILWFMMTGEPPFADSPPSLDDVEEGDLDFEVITQEDVREVLQGLLHPDPQSRWSLQQLLSHPWFRTDLDCHLFPGLQTRRSSCRNFLDFSRIAHKSTASGSGIGGGNPLLAPAIPRSGSGSNLTKHDTSSGTSSPPLQIDPTTALIESTFDNSASSKFDANWSPSRIDREANEEAERDATQAEQTIIRRAFDNIDEDHNGFLTRDEIRDVVIRLRQGLSVHEEEVDKIMDLFLSPEKRGYREHLRYHQNNQFGPSTMGLGGVGSATRDSLQPESPTTPIDASDGPSRHFDSPPSIPPTRHAHGSTPTTVHHQHHHVNNSNLSTTSNSLMGGNSHPPSSTNLHIPHHPFDRHSLHYDPTTAPASNASVASSGSPAANCPEERITYEDFYEAWVKKDIAHSNEDVCREFNLDSLRHLRSRADSTERDTVLQIRRSFDMLDETHSGRFDKHCLVDAFHRAGQTVTDDQATELMGFLGFSYHNDFVSFDEFLASVVERDLLVKHPLGEIVAKVTNLINVRRDQELHYAKHEGLTLSGTPERIVDRLLDAGFSLECENRTQRSSSFALSNNTSGRSSSFMGGADLSTAHTTSNNTITVDKYVLYEGTTPDQKLKLKVYPCSMDDYTILKLECPAAAQKTRREQLNELAAKVIGCLKSQREEMLKQTAAKGEAEWL